MTRNLHLGEPTDGGVVTRPGRRALHMPRTRPVDFNQARKTGRDPNTLSVLNDPDRLAAAMGDLSKVLRHMGPGVLQSELIVLDNNGTASKQFRVPFAAMAVTSWSANTLTASSAPLQTAAPGPGPGTVPIPARGFRCFNVSGYAWSIYGGQPGELIHVETYARPMPPASAQMAALVGQTLVEPANPAAGASQTYAAFTGPTLVTLAKIRLVTSAVVANRFLQLQFIAPSGNVAAVVQNNSAVVATSTLDWTCAIGFTQTSAATGPAVAPLPSQLYVGPGWTLKWVISGGDVGDQLSITEITYLPAP